MCFYKNLYGYIHNNKIASKKWIKTRSVNPLSANPEKWSNTLKQMRRQFADDLFECV